ncbi:hypothetical protein [Halomonas dongshanensis]|uniref:Uncharacterized protein n=1 Tax=Halomonas dongshanensis TaxID=2890835 RepID=A0ABT2EIL0_9GAMM|nr:hypothetical protein [Halomonas dongshanensis]MCS2611193.1 hypothetical protein [Halomonas dongshanensis]
MGQVALVSFSLMGARYALEARRVLRMDAHASLERRVSAAELLTSATPAASRSLLSYLPARWLTLRDGEGFWQLGVEGGVQFDRWPAEALLPLPPLVIARCQHPGLRGVALDADRPAMWLLDAQQLSPNSSVLTTKS